MHNIPGIATVQFDKRDIVRHKLVQKIVDAYDHYEEERKKLTIVK